ncbi:MAG: type II secretion system F family protein [Planctomycetota bacterium]
MDTFFLLCNVVMGVCTAGAALVSQGWLSQLVNYLEVDLRDRLRSLRIQTPHLRTWIVAWLGSVLLVFTFLWLGFDLWVFAILLAMLMCAGPWYLVRRLAATRRQRIEDQLADAMVMFSNGVKAGLSLSQSLKLLSEECPKPIRQEFQQIVGEYNLGKPLERTMTEAKERLRSENFLLFAAALLASRESGGRLNETVERISRSVLELQRLERKVKAETAQARKSAIYMSIVPSFILIAYYYLDPQNTRLLFLTLPGQIMLTVCVIFNLAAYFWAIKILNADI